MMRGKARWARLVRRIAAADPLLLCLDYDGTLVPIAAHPSQARLPAPTRRLLRQLSRQQGIRVVVVSGRALPELERRVAVPGLYYVGNHGLELSGPRIRYVHAAARASRPRIRRLARRLRAALRPVPGAWVEEKGLTASVHLRAVRPAARQRCLRIVAAVTAPERRRAAIRLTRGKEVVELRPPVRWGKGESVAWIRERLTAGGRAARPVLVYLGDDETDEGAFRMVNRFRGCSVFVGVRPQATAARWRMRGPRDVRAALAAILEARRWARKRAA